MTSSALRPCWVARASSVAAKETRSDSRTRERSRAGIVAPAWLDAVAARDGKHELLVATQSSQLVIAVMRTGELSNVSVRSIAPDRPLALDVATGTPDVLAAWRALLRDVLDRLVAARASLREDAGWRALYERVAVEGC